VGQIFGSPAGREASWRDNSANRDMLYCTLIPPILVLFPFQQQLMPCVEIPARMGAERGAVLTKAALRQQPFSRTVGASLGFPARPGSAAGGTRRERTLPTAVPTPHGQTNELQKSGRPNHTAEAVPFKTEKKMQPSSCRRPVS